MRVFLKTLPLFFFCLVSSILWAQAGDAWPASNMHTLLKGLHLGQKSMALDTTPRTKVRWAHDTLFFGKIEEGTLLLDSFVVTNIGDKPYLIRDVRASCDCTIIKYPQKPLLPGQSAALRLEFDSTRKAGPTQPGIIVYDNSSPNARSILYLDGEVTPRKQVKVIRQ